jgi:hypothetical protein
MPRSLPDVFWRSKATYAHPRDGQGVYRVVLLRGNFYVLTGINDNYPRSCPQDWARSIHQNEDAWIKEIQRGCKLKNWVVKVTTEGKFHLTPS